MSKEENQEFELWDGSLEDSNDQGDIFADDISEPDIHEEVEEKIDNPINVESEVSIKETEEETEEEIEEETEEEIEEDDDSDDNNINDVTVDESEENVEETEAITSWYELFKEKGLINVEDDFDGSIESFEKLLEKENQLRNEAAINAFWEAMPSDEFRSLIEYGLSGGKNIEEFKEVFSTNSISKMNENDINEENAEQLLKTYYKETTRFSEQKIQKEIDRLKDLDELIESAQEALPELKELDDIKKQEFLAKEQKEIENQEKERIKIKNDLENLLESKDKFIDFELTKHEKEVVKDSIFKSVKLKDGTVTNAITLKLNEALNDPEQYIRLAAFLSLEKAIEKKITKNESRANESLRKKLNKISKTNSGPATMRRTRGRDTNNNRYEITIAK